MVLRTFLFFLVSSAAAFAAPPICPAGLPVGTAKFLVKRSGIAPAIPLRKLNRMEEGDLLIYEPVLRPNEKRHGKVSFVLVPASASERADERLVVLDPKDANKTAKWKVPFRTALTAFVYGPNGLDAGKVKGFLSKDDELISQLADYAEKTAQTESVLQALSKESQQDDSFGAALQGFAAQGGTAKIDRNSSLDQQTIAAFRSLNPALSAYDPIAAPPGQRLGQATGLAATVAAMFFGSPVGLAAGGTAMALNLKTMLFPNSEFRSSFAQTAPDNSVALCGKRDPARGHARLAFLWALRIPDEKAPALTIAPNANVALGIKNEIEANSADVPWKFIDRAHGWKLTSADGKTLAVPVTAESKHHTLELDLTAANLTPGRYELSGKWDWDAFTAKGVVTVHALPDLSEARLTVDTHDLLRPRSGKVIVRADGADFEFVKKVELKRDGDKYDPPFVVPFSLSKGFARGPQQDLEMQVNTSALDVGKYSLLVYQANGKASVIPVAVLPEPPRVSDLPLVVSESDEKQRVVLHGEGLDRITGLEAVGATFELAPAAPQSREREATVLLAPGSKQGSVEDLRLRVQGYAQPIVMPAALRIAGPRPRVLEARLATPTDMAVSLEKGELAAGAFISTMMRVQHAGPDTSVRIGCRGGEGTPVVVRAGMDSAAAKLQLIGPGEMFLSFDPGNWPSGCTLQATLVGGDIESRPFTLGRVVRVPRIESFKLTNEPAGEGAYYGVITGTDLEVIQKTGWDPDRGVAVTTLPAAIAGEGQKQTLRVAMPWPSPAPHAPVYVWLRGDATGRSTTARD